MKRKILAGCVGVFALVFVACGDSSDANGVDKTEEISKEDGTPLVETYDELPNCTAKREGDSVYVEEEDLTFICQDGTWEEADEGEEDSPKSSDSNKNDDDEGSDDSDGDTDSYTDDNTASSASGSEEDSGYATEEDLPNCTAKREGLEAYVKDADVTFVCRNEIWVDKAELPPSFATEEDLPVCSAKREGVKVWLEDAGALVVCASQKWTVVEESSASTTPGSSASTESSAGNGGSSGSVEESSTSTLSSSSVAVTGRIAGTCSAPVNPFNGLPKNVETTWSFTNSTTNLTPETYDWTFDEGASIPLSTDAAPKVSYSKDGTHKATLIVNKGLDSESKEITCSVKVTGTRVKNCGCTTTTTSPIRVTPTEPRTVSWAVSGCTGAGPFTYSWSSGYAGTGATGTRSIGTEGTYAPTVTITNSEEMDTTITCGSVVAQEPPSATCVLTPDSYGYSSTNTTLSAIPGGAFYFLPKNVAHISGTVDMTLTVNGASETIAVGLGNSTTRPTRLTAPSVEGEYPVTLTYNGELLCSATLTVAWPKITSTSCTINGNKFSPGSSFKGWVGADNLSMDFYRDDTKLTSLTVNRYYNGDLYTVTIPTEPGSYDFRLVYHGNEVCKITKTVALPTTCSIGAMGSASGTSYTAVPGQLLGFKPGNSSIAGSVNMDLTLDGDTQTIGVVSSNNVETTLIAPSTLGTYPVTLSYNGKTLCTTTLTVDLPKPVCNIGAVGNAKATSYMTNVGESFDFKPGNSSFVGTIDLDLTLDDNVQSIMLKPTNNTATRLTAPDVAGTYPVTLSYNGEQVCAATLTVVDFEEVTATGTYTGPRKIKFVNNKTCLVRTSTNTWSEWILDGLIGGNWGSSGQISGTMYIDIPSGQSFTIESCW